ncbi:uncharacterized protein LOC130591679 [Beta vulgaris subsp. vulgaris]|uniref:uncharacterized protein LOC130591679 n=1 Tax=Beta vulgaris subsp. vulgaris TaxID=3555 RepID=UPI0025491868|nr:uncharacterized protein LOC130591679 [Beta vulgaris subsp. vulgaris]
MDGDILEEEPDGEKDETLMGANILSAEDKGWLSLPDSIYSSSSDGGSVSGEVSPSNGFGLEEALEHLSINSNNEEDGDQKERPFSTATKHQDILHNGMLNEMIVKDDSTGLSTDVHPNDLRDGVCLENKLSADSVPSMLKEENLEMNLEGKDEATSSNRVGLGEDS